MTASSFPSINVSLPPSSLLSFSNTSALLYNCFNATAAYVNITVYTMVSIVFLVPLYVLVLYLGLQRRWQKRSGTTMSHTDLFTYHMTVIELMNNVGLILMCFGIHLNLTLLVNVGMSLFDLNFCSQLFFHMLTCAERYLAAVHPVTYLRLREAKWIRIRNITIGCVWLMCFLAAGLVSRERNSNTGKIFSYITSVSSIIVSFCSLSVLCVLIRPRPGEEGRGRYQVDQSKLRALCTITAILVALLIRFGGNTLVNTIYSNSQYGEHAKCNMMLSVIWTGLPSSLVQPVLFLQRARKQLCCKTNK